MNKTLEDFLIGFESFADKTKSFCPRYNVIKLDDSGYKLEVAVPGVNRSDLRIEVVDGELHIELNSSKDEEQESAYQYLVKGISTKNFFQRFKLDERLEVVKANLSNGLLSVFLSRKEQKNNKIEVEIQTDD